MISVIGLGYIGLPTALILASQGIEVIGVDYDKGLVSRLNTGEITFEEEGMYDQYITARKAGIKFSTEYVKADIYIVAVPTPYDKKNNRINTSYVAAAVKSVLEVCEEGAIIVLESTVPPGTIEKCLRPLLIKTIHFVHAPERIAPGNMLFELKNNARTIGADDFSIGKKIKEIYSSFCEGEIIVTDIRTAEMTKVVENAYRDINIAYANELAKICRYDNLNVYDIINIANKHPRVNILNPGPGVGGHCISVDPWFLVGNYPGLANIVLAARKINDSMPEFVLERIYEIMEENQLKDVTRVGLYGLTYKENVDDVRESPTMQMLECMKKHLSFGVKTYDPYVKNDIVENQYHDLTKFISDVDIVVVMVAHNEILNNIKYIKNKIILDTKNKITGIRTYKI